MHNHMAGDAGTVLQAGSIMVSQLSSRVVRVIVAVLSVIALAAVSITVWVWWPRPPVAAPTSSPPGGTSSSTAEAASAPLVVAAQSMNWKCSIDWLVPRAPDQVDLTRSEDLVLRWNDWPALADGVAADRGQVQLTVQPKGTASVVLTGMRIRVTDRRQPMAGTSLDGRCGGPETFRWVDVDLDEEQPEVRGRPLDARALAEAETNGWRVDPVTFPYEITAQDSETFFISASTSACDCSWVVEFDWAAGGETGQFVVDKMFRTSASSRAVRCSVLSERVTCP
ncbi:hypothetical protein CKY47_17810 [Saccharothrix yanglingensis]|uniref:Uncharacterized protein n=1 Tax=Saccharothrix yanglingensis TaxID=659496 RepID=A0ABU0X3E4_9PSEU|nr:hypothetical protein [Saccharothrix yanglingensis]